MAVTDDASTGLKGGRVGRTADRSDRSDRTPTGGGCDVALGRVAEMLREADAVVIAASNGFDIADGYNQFASDETFMRLLGDFYRAYGLTSMLQGLMARWGSEEARWAFLARLIDYGYRGYKPSPVMSALDGLTTGLPRFVVTCNCNGRFERARFAADAIFETEGSYARLRCAAGRPGVCAAGCDDDCANEDYDVLPFVEPLLAAARAGSVPADLLPRCPRCGSPLDAMVGDGRSLSSLARYRDQRSRFEAFLDAHRTGRVLVLELGIGQRNQAIKLPLMRYASSAPHALYAAFNREAAQLPAEMGERSVAVAGDLGAALLDLASLVGAAHGTAAAYSAACDEGRVNPWVV